MSFWASWAIAVVALAGCSCPLMAESCVNLDGRSTCYTLYPNTYRYFGIETNYGVQRRSFPIPDTYIEPGCEPVFLQLFVRHSTRYPSLERIQRMQYNLPRLQKQIEANFYAGRSGMCQLDIERLHNFRMNITEDQAYLLAAVGERDARELGVIFKNRFPEILNQTYDPKGFLFEHSSTERTERTAHFIAEGIFGKENAEKVRKRKNDNTLYFNEICKMLQQSFAACSLPEESPEVAAFKGGPVIQALSQSISTRLGFSVSKDEVFDMYNACRFGYDLEMDDIWCAVFTNDELVVLQYGRDLEYYWKDGYGNVTNSRIACRFAQSLTSRLQSAAKHQPGKRIKAIVQASHDTELKNIYAMMNLFRDDQPLLADNMCSLMSRYWFSGIISTFQSNLAFVLYQCPGNRYKVLTLNNERSVTIGGCTSHFCDLEDILRTYKPYADDCRFEQFCCSDS